jgi:hypothetical protein
VIAPLGTIDSLAPESVEHDNWVKIGCGISVVVECLLSKICNRIAGLHRKPLRTTRFNCNFGRLPTKTVDAGHALSSKKLLNEVTLPLMALQ